MNRLTRTDPGDMRLPGWVSLALGIAAIGLGLWLIVRPVSSWNVLVLTVAGGLLAIGLSRLGTAGERPHSRLLGLLWAALGIAILVWPNLTVRTVIFVVGIYLIVDGIGDVVDSIRGRADQRVAGFILGLATVVFGVLALRWPDMTLLVVAVIFAARLIIFGAGRVVAFFSGSDQSEEPKAPGLLRRWVNVVGAVLALLVAGGLALASARLNDGVPVVDDFYTAPGEVPAEPGALLRSEPFSRGIPDDARAWRILYTTTRGEGQPAVASAIVVAPQDAAGASPVIAWAHGTTGIDETCAPSVLEGTFSTGAFFSVEEVIEEGWVLVATDYVGLGTKGPHPYLTGNGEARSVLDAVRAVRQMDEVEVGDETVVWGHSQGGNAALWTGVLAPTYSPDVSLAGVAALAPASDLTGLVDSLPGVTGGAIFASYVVSAYAAVFDDVRLSDYVVPAGEVAVREIAGRCLAEPSVLTSVLTSVTVSFSAFRPDLSSGALADRFAEAKAPYTIEAPLLLAQGTADSLITVELQDAYVKGLCEAGRQVDYRLFEDLGHVPLVEADSPLIPALFEWTHARLAGENPMSTCGV